MCRFFIPFFLAYICGSVPCLFGALAPVGQFPIEPGPLTIRRDRAIAKPFTVAGEHGAILGQQSGECEAWIFPVKILSKLSLTAAIEGYERPVDLSTTPGAIEVSPGHTTITYANAAFTVRQHMFAPRGEGGESPIILFELHALHRMQLTVRFQPIVGRMWPAPNFGRPSAEWVKEGAGGYYVLHTDNQELTAAVALPGATRGDMESSYEQPRALPLEFKLNFDPKADDGRFFPLLLAVSAKPAELPDQLARLNNSIPALYAQTEAHYRTLLANSLSVHSPDNSVNSAMAWAIVSIDQLQVLHGKEVGLVAGYYGSGDSLRPGYGWYFGRDTLWTLYAVHSYGDFQLARNAFEFLLRRQRADGKIMHEYSQTADLVDWKSLPYFYAAADSTPLLLMAAEDYVRTSGDISFIHQHWDAFKLAYSFLTSHDSDGDGIYENTEGTGWVEGWPPKMPHQEIYLAATDGQGSGSFAYLAALMKDDAAAKNAKARAENIHKKIAAEYFDQESQFYAFSRNADGSIDKTATIYPAVAWWTGQLALPNAAPMLSRWASSEFSTDWGTRDLSSKDSKYDAISYHQGSVWPLFTGWVSLAEFHAGRPLSATAHLMHNLNLTGAQDLGSVTELLSGDFFEPLGRSSSHQLWSSAMVLSPAIRGLFGLNFDALHHTLHLAPHLPAEWDHVDLQRVSLGDLHLNLHLERAGSQLKVKATADRQAVFCVAAEASDRSAACTATAAMEHTLALPLPAVEVDLPHLSPVAGATTQQVKAVDEQSGASQWTVTLEAPGGSVQQLFLRRNRTGVQAEGASIEGSRLSVTFPPGAGYQRQTIRFHW